MKKSAVILTSVVCGGMLLLGCTTPSTPANVAKSLENNLNNLTTTINKLDTIDNSYLSNPDIYPITSSISTPAPESKKLVAKVSTNNLNVFIPISKQKRKVAKLNLNLETEQADINTEDVIINNFETIEQPEEIVLSEVEITEQAEITDTEQLTETSSSTETQENIQENTQETKPEVNNTTIYYYESKPIRYAPRYLNSNAGNEDYLANYIGKVRNLYAITNDAIVANNQLSNYKDNVLSYCVEIKDLNSNIKDGTFVPSSQQIAALNNYIDDIKITIKRIKKCNGDLSDEVDSINKTDVGGITAGIDVINSNYLSVLNHLDTRITYLKNALTTLEQIKYLLQEAQNIVETNPEIPSQVVTPDVITPDISDVEQPSTNDYAVNENTNSDTLETEEGLTENNSESTNVDNVDNNINTESEPNNNVTNSDETETNNSQNSNIDTYLNTNNNLDTYKNANNEIANNEVVDNNTTNNNGLVENNTISDTQVLPNTNNTPIVNNGVNGNYIVSTDEENINAPNGRFQNGIITQNNLNNGVNNGVNGTNTGYAGSYNYPATNGDNTRSNKNVDTYGYNTMIDMLNHGTVNNGINTLSITEEVNTKPSMVNSENVVTENDVLNENNSTECEDCNTDTDCEECLDDCKENLENCEEVIENYETALENCEDCLENNEESLEQNNLENTEETVEESSLESVEIAEDINKIATKNSNETAPKQDEYQAELL